MCLWLAVVTLRSAPQLFNTRRKSMDVAFVAMLFLSVPYGNFVHFFYRFGALIRAHAEARA